VGFATKNEIALTLIEQALADQVLPAPVLGDSAYGDGFAFRARLRELKMEFFLQVTPEEHRGWTEEVPTTLKGKYRTVDEKTAQSAHNLLEIARFILLADSKRPMANWRSSGSWSTGPREPRSHVRPEVFFASR
jgi:SRSO17 transposase